MAEEARNVPSQGVRVDRRREISRRRFDLKRQRVALALIGFFLLVILGILIAGYVRIFVMPPRQLVVRVGEVKYTRGDMVKLLRVRQKGAEFLGGNFNASTDIFQALQLLVENEIIAQSAPRYGVTVSPEEVDGEIKRLLSPSGPASLGKSEDQLEKEFRERYGSYLNTIQLSREEHRQIVRMAILREKFRQFIGEAVPVVTAHARLHRLVVNPQDEVDIMQVKYKDYVGTTETPESYQQAFFNITREFSRDDPEAVRMGGDIGWVPQGIFEDYDDIIWRLEPGKLSDPTTNIDKPGDMFVFMVSEKTDARELSPFNRDTLKTRALQDWINKERDNHDVYAVFNSDIYNWMIKQLGLTTTVTPEPKVDPLQGILGGRGR